MAKVAACYSGPTPVTDDERAAIWKWAKENGIDKGMPIEKVGDSINQHFFAGQAKPEWISDILSGRKTPFRFQANDAWKAQYNRRQIVQQAKDMSRQQTMGPAWKMMRTLTDVPRSIATFGHAAVFPITHGGDLAFRPASWGAFMRGIFNTYSGAYNPAYHARIMANLERQPLFDTALRSGLDIGAGSHASGLISSVMGKSSERAWDMLKTMRFELWNREMQKFTTPDMTHEQQVEVGRNLADWANHATGATTKPVFGKLGGALFGPKLTASKLSRLFGDPAKTIKTFSNWGAATPGEKAAAWTRLSGAAQYTGSLLGFLAVNQGLNMALGSKQQVNFTDPTKSDWLQFKAGGLEGYFPGLHSEIRTLGQILATSWMSKKQLRGESRQAHLGDIVGQYAMGKVTPSISLAKDVLTGQNWSGRPLPWSSDPGKPDKPGKLPTSRMSWGEYAGTMGPIPLQGPVGYVYDKMRQGGASAMDTTAIIKGLIISGLGATGLHVKEEPPPTLAQLKQQRAAQALRSK